MLDLAYWGIASPGRSQFAGEGGGSYSSSSLALADALRTAALLNDAEGVRQAAHALKSSSANVGALAFAELCKSVELRQLREGLPRSVRW